MIVSSEVASSSCSACLNSAVAGDLRDLDVGDAQLANAILQLLQKPGVADRRQPLRRIGGDECALPLNLDEHLFADQLAQRLAQGHAADRQLVRQIVFRRNLCARPVLPVVNPVAEQMLDLVIQRDARFFAEPE